MEEQYAVRVCPLGFDPAIYRPSPVRMSGPCVFAAAGRLGHGIVRKGVNRVIEEFRLAFPGTPDVRLALAASGRLP